MEKPLKKKLANLKQLIQNLQSVMVAYSGGVDSTLLLGIAREVLKDKVKAIIARSLLHPAREYESAQRIAREIGVPCFTIHTEELKIPEFIQNHPDRCYHCKKELFTKILIFAQGMGIENVVEGTNSDDIHDFRPGMKALVELRIRSPLKEVGLTKADIRLISRELGLITWDKPSYSCLASRFPYGEKINPNDLQRVEKAEGYLHQKGFRQLRLRIHRDLVRIEVAPEEISRFMENSLRSQILNHLKNIGFTYITLDLEGYRTGSMNEPVLPLDGKVKDTNLVVP